MNTLPTFDDNKLNSQEVSENTLSPEMHQRLLRRGQRWMCMGLGLLGGGLGINYLLFHSNGSFLTIMYVVTTLGALCVVKGLADIFGF